MRQPAKGLNQEKGIAQEKIRLSQEQQKEFEKAIKKAVYSDLYERRILCDQQLNQLWNWMSDRDKRQQRGR